jgi:hypothetical protein
MKSFYKIILVGVFVSLSVPVIAQSKRDLRLNEFLVINTHDFQDDFGQQNAGLRFSIPGMEPLTLEVAT